MAVNDALLALQAAVGKLALTDGQAERADVDGQAGISVTDALLILQYSVGKITVFRWKNNPFSKFHIQAGEMPLVFLPFTFLN